jgi:hypothetical protein
MIEILLIFRGNFLFFLSTALCQCVNGRAYKCVCDIADIKLPTSLVACYTPLQTCSTPRFA